MKKIFSVIIAVCAIWACDPTHEDINMGNHITVEQLKEMTTVTLDKAPSGQNGNVVTCETHAPVSAAWNAGGKDLAGNYVTKKLKLGEHVITLTALCGDGTKLTAEFPVKVQEITDPLVKYYLYGEPGKGQEPFEVPSWNSNYMRFSDTDSPVFKVLPDNVYWGFKTLIYDCAEGTDAVVKVMSGWWDNVNVDDQHWVAGLNELQLTEDIAKICAKKDLENNACTGHELTTMVTSGTAIVKAVYYEE